MVATSAHALCAFNRFTGVTVCEVRTGNPPVPTGQVVVSKPNQGIPGTFISDDGKIVTEVFLGHNGTGKQKFHWQN